MKLRFYFDYSDYRSYLMMHALRVLDNLPVAIQWVAIDAYSLRALAGVDGRNYSQLERSFMKREAMRFCQREGLEFVWQDDDLHLGTPLRVGIWLMAHHHSCFEEFSRQVIEAVWGFGKIIDHDAMRNILASLDIDFDEILRSTIENESFQMQDAMLHEAISDGIFDVPTVLIGDNLICQYDQAFEIKRLAVLECLQNIPQNIVYNAFASSLVSMRDDDCKNQLLSMTRRMETRQSTLLVVDQGVSVQHSLDIPEFPWNFDQKQPSAPLACHLCHENCRSLKDAIDDIRPECINLFVGSDTDGSALADMKFPRKTLVFIWFDVANRALRMLLQNEKIKNTVSYDLMSHDDFEVIQFNGWNLAGYAADASRDLNLVRLNALSKVHVHCRISDAEHAPVSETVGCIAHGWCIEFSKNGVSLSDAQAHRMKLKPGTDFSLDAGYLLANAQSWLPVAPRTLLLCEQSFSLGEIAENADLEFSARGVNLLVSAKGQSSEISPSRVFEKIRIKNAQLIIVPIAGEQIFRTESISQRFIRMLNRAPREGMPLFVNYWTELEFEMLDFLRPVISATVQMFSIPIVLVVGSQIVEIWLPSSSGAAWRIEKEDDRFTFDLSEVLSCDRCMDRLLAGLNVSEELFIERLRRFE